MGDARPRNMNSPFDIGQADLRGPSLHCMLRAEKFGPFHADPVIGSVFFWHVPS